MTAEHIKRVIASWTAIPLEKLNIGDREKLLNLQSILEERVLGQAEALEAVSGAVMRARAQLNRPHGPLGSFLFLGPTGVGKTELAKRRLKETQEELSDEASAKVSHQL